MIQYLLNLALWADLTLSTFLGGYPRETISRRLARARIGGSKPACWACGAISWIGGKIAGTPIDHCAVVMTDAPSIGREVWDWGGPK